MSAMYLLLVLCYSTWCIRRGNVGSLCEGGFATATVFNRSYSCYLVSIVLQIFIKMMAFSSFRSLSGPKMSNQEGREGWGRWRDGGGGWGGGGEGMQHVILSQPLINK